MYPHFFPQSFTLDNYAKLFTDTTILNFPQMFMNTLFIAICSCILATFYVLAVSYCLSRLRFKMRKPYMNMAMILGPGFQAYVHGGGVFYPVRLFGLTEGNLIRLVLILCYSGGAGLTFQIAKGFFDTVPRAIDEAALIDGCNRWQIFSKITLPLSKPIIIYTVLTSFISPWVDFIFAKGKLSADMQARQPSLNTRRFIRIVNGRHPLLTSENPGAIECGVWGKDPGRHNYRT